MFYRDRNHWLMLSLLTAAVVIAAGMGFSGLAVSQQWADQSGPEVPDTWPYGAQSGASYSTNRPAAPRPFAQQVSGQQAPRPLPQPPAPQPARPVQYDEPAPFADPSIVIPPPWPGRNGNSSGNNLHNGSPTNGSATNRAPAASPSDAQRRTPELLNQRGGAANSQPTAKRMAQTPPQPSLGRPEPAAANRGMPVWNQVPEQLVARERAQQFKRTSWDVPPAPEPLPFSPEAAVSAAGLEPQINPYAEVTPRGKVTANQWKGPIERPIHKIEQTSFTSRVHSDDDGAIPAEALLSGYSGRAADYPDKVNPVIPDGQLKEIPRDYAPWWDGVINRSFRGQSTSLDVDAESLVLKALENSPQVTAMRIDPTIREWIIYEEMADFDWTAFLDTNYDTRSEPIGSSLIRGSTGINRYRDDNVTSRGGLKKKLDNGGRLDVSQRVGYQDNNAAYFIPADQGTTRMEVNFTQPLLRGAGSTVAQSRIVLAQLDQSFSSYELSEKLQDHLVSVYQAYWSLYRARANRLQKERLLERAAAISKLLEARQGIDSLNRQVLRSKAAVASRRSEVIRADTTIRNVESQLRLLVNSSDLKEHSQLELLPTEIPMLDEMDVSLRGSVETALTHRPDVAQAIQRIKAETLRLGVARNELLPKLDVLFGTYVLGLQGHGDVSQSFQDQFTRGRPSFTVGVLFEYPLGNRAAKARHERREWELMKAVKEFEASVESGMTDVEISVREMQTAYQEMLSHFQAMVAAENEASYLEERWKLLPGNDQSLSFLLENLLDAQVRVAAEEADFVNSQVGYVLSVVNLKRSTGILLNCNLQVDVVNKKVREAPINLPLPEMPELPIIQAPKQ